MLIRRRTRFLGINHIVQVISCTTILGHSCNLDTIIAKIIALVIEEGKQLGLFVGTAKVVHTVNHVLGHGKSCPTDRDNRFAGTEVHKLVCTRQVSFWTKTNGSDGSGCWGVCGMIGYIGLYIGAEGELAMLFCVQIHACNDGSRAQSLRDPTLGRKGIDPHDRVVNQFHQHQQWQNFERQGVACCSDPLFDDTNLSLDCWHMRIGSDGLQLDSQRIEVFRHMGELTVHLGHCDLEATGRVQLHNSLHRRGQLAFRAARTIQSGRQANVVADSSKERNLVDKEHIAVQGHIFVGTQDLFRDGNNIGNHLFRGLSDRLSFQDSHARAVNLFGSVNVIHRHRAICDLVRLHNHFQVSSTGMSDD